MTLKSKKVRQTRDDFCKLEVISVPASDAQDRLARACDLVLRAAARATNKTAEEHAREPRTEKRRDEQ
jgi:hypothetical protein